MFSSVMDRLFFHRLGSRLKCLVLLDHNESYNTEASLRVVFFFFSHAAYWFLLLAFFANVKIFFLPLLEERQILGFDMQQTSLTVF